VQLLGGVTAMSRLCRRSALLKSEDAMIHMWEVATENSRYTCMRGNWRDAHEVAKCARIDAPRLDVIIPKDSRKPRPPRCGKSSNLTLFASALIYSIVRITSTGVNYEKASKKSTAKSTTKGSTQQDAYKRPASRTRRDG